MINDTQQKIINTLINRFIETNMDNIGENMMKGIDDLPITELYPQMIKNSMTLAVQISVSVVASLLQDAGLEIVPDDEKTLRRLQLSVVSHPEQDDRD